ncbi:MAG TPA: hypothetical protein VFC92_10605 [Bacteroidales bacterium]|nr:hypothetical protein [Bacteroidales bacterium]
MIRPTLRFGLDNPGGMDNPWEPLWNTWKQKYLYYPKIIIMKRLKAVTKDKNGNPTYNMCVTEADIDWMLAGRLLKKANAGDKAAAKELKKMNDTKLTFFTLEEIEASRKIAEMRKQEREMIIIDDSELQWDAFSLTCYTCAHLTDKSPANRTCPAFPKGIPMDIWNGHNPHTEIYKGQVGNFVYEKE